jgi:hypothetical protein
MAEDITFKIKRGVSGGAFPPGLTHGELAVNTTDQRLFVGSVTGGVIPFNRVFTGGLTPQNAVEGDYWYSGSLNYVYYDGSWNEAGGGGGLGFGEISPSITGGLNVYGPVTVTGSASITGGLAINGGGLGVTGGASITGGLNVYGPVTVTGNVILNGNLQVLGTYPGSAGVNPDVVLLLRAGMVVTGNSVFNSGITSNHLYVSKGVTFNSTSVHIGLATFNAGITSDHLYVSKGATFNGSSTFLGNQTNINGNVTINDSSARTLLVRGPATFNNSLRIDAGLSVTGSASITGGLAINGGGLGVTGGIAVRDGLIVQTGGLSVQGTSTFASFVIANAGITSNHLYVSNGVTFNSTSVHTGLATFNGGIAGTINTASQPNITSLGTLSTLTSSGLATFNNGITTDHLYVSKGVTFNSTSVHTGLATFNGGIAGTINTSSQPNVTLLGTLSSLTSSGLATFNNGITSDHLYVSKGVTFNSTSVHIGLATFNAGITSNHLYVSNGVTFNSTSVHTGLATFNGGIAGTINTASQPNITSLGTLSTLTSSGLATFNNGITSDHLYVSKGATFNGPIKIAGITGGLSVTGGATITGGVALFGTVTVNGSVIGALPANVARTDTDQVFTATQRFNSGIHVTGGASITEGLTAYGPARIIGTLDVTGGTATFVSMQVGNITGAYFMSQQGFTAEYIHAVHIGGGMYSVGLDIANQGLATRLASGLEQVYRWGARGLLSANNAYGYYRLSASLVTSSIFPPPSSVSNNHLPIAKSIQKIVDYTQKGYSFGQIALLQDKSLTAWGFRLASIFPSFPQPTVSFIDVATGGSGSIGANTLTTYETAGWWLGLMENGRLTGGTWHADRTSGTFLLSTTDHGVLDRMPASLRWDSVSGITAKAILSTDDAYCYAILSNGSLTAWGATCFMIGGSGGAGTWTTGGTGGILSNFPPPTDTFTGFASRRANRTVAFAIKSDGNLRCVGYTGNTGIVSGSPSGMRLVDYRSIFCNTRTGDNQIVKVETICDNSYSQNSIYGSQISPSPASTPGQFIHKMYRTSISQDWRIFVGLTKGGSLTAGVHIVNDSAFPTSSYLHPFSEMWNQYTSTPGITFSDISCGPRVILGKKADSSVVAYGLTNDLSPGSQDNTEWYQVTQVPSAFLQGRITTTRFGGPVNITYSPLGESDPYTASSLLDVRGGVVAGGFSIASDSSLKTNVEEKRVGDKVVSLWKKDLLDNLSAKEFTYIGDQNTTPNIGYFAEDVKNANEYYVTQINPVSINADRPPNSTDETNTPYSAINLNALMVGTIESLRELDTEMSRIWTMESPPYPSKVKNGDLWYYSGENRLYVRRNDVWIQVN